GLRPAGDLLEVGVVGDGRGLVHEVLSHRSRPAVYRRRPRLAESSTMDALRSDRFPWHAYGDRARHDPYLDLRCPGPGSAVELVAQRPAELHRDLPGPGGAHV